MIRIFETFAGYGTATFALKELGVPHELVGFSEINKYAIQCFEKNHGGKNFGSITEIKWEEMPDFDLITGGFPCQDVSSAGRQDLTKGRTILGYELIDALRVKQPKYFLFENVKGLTQVKFNVFRRDLIGKLGQQGYVVFSKVLNTKDFGVPQNRERVWFVGIRKDVWNKNELAYFNWPVVQRLDLKLKDLLEPEVDERYFLNDERAKELIGKTKDKVSSTIDASYYKGPNTDNRANRTLIELTEEQSQAYRVYSPDGVSATLGSSSGGVGAKTGLYAVGGAIRTRDTLNGRAGELEESGEFSNCLSSVQKDSLVVCHNLQPRSPNHPSHLKAKLEGKPAPGGFGHLQKDDGTTYCLDTGNAQAVEIIAIQLGNSEARGNPVNDSGVAFCLTRTEPNGLISNTRIRRLTPRECFRLQGFLRDQINLEGISDTQCYKLAGNGQSLNVVTLIFKELLKGEF